MSKETAEKGIKLNQGNWRNQNRPVGTRYSFDVDFQRLIGF